MFTDATAARMPVDRDLAGAVGLGDVDGGGDLDIVLDNSVHSNQLYLNDATGTLVDATAGACRLMPTSPQPWLWATRMATATATSTSTLGNSGAGIARAAGSSM